MNLTKEQQAAKNIAGELNTFGFSNAKFCETMLMEHRTLQQSFTGLCFAWIRALSDAEEWMIDGRNEAAHEACKRIVKTMDEEGIRSLPMI